MSYELLPHTADLRASLRARTLEELYQAAVSLARDVLVGDSSVEVRDERRITADVTDEAERFFRFLRELIYLYDAEGFIPASLGALEPLTVVGESFDPDRHTSHHQVKALTRHEYIFRRSRAGYHVAVIFDL